MLRALADHGLSVADLDAVCGRGGLLRPIPHGTYRVGTGILDDLRAGAYGDHASNLGALIAHELASPAGKPAFIVDPVVVDEAPPRVKITGVKAIRRRVISHALNQVASARRYAQESETFYEKVNVIVCHMGGGISVGAHRRGRYIDANNALDGEGPFSPERSGSLPQGQLAELCFSGRLTHPQVRKLIKGAGGLIDLLGTSDLREVERRIEAGDAEAAEVFDALAYQIAKAVSAVLPAFEGARLDRIILTGGMARSQTLVERLSRYLSGLPAESPCTPARTSWSRSPEARCACCTARKPYASTRRGPARNRPRISPVAKTLAPSPRLVWAPPEPRNERCSKQDSAREARLDYDSRCKWATSLITVLAEDAQKGTIFQTFSAPLCRPAVEVPAPDSP